MTPALRRRHNRRLSVGLVYLALVCGCEPNLVVGKWSGGSGTDAGSGGSGADAGSGAEGGFLAEGGAAGDGGASATSSCDGAAGEAPMRRVSTPVAMPWSTGFEDAFCDYSAVAGYCYNDPQASYRIVSSPVHSGDSAAAFSLIADGTFDGMQARCVRQGTLPNAAYYSAFFFIPSAPSAANNWNLIHFRGGEATEGTTLHGLWDVSLARQADGSYRVFVFDFLRTQTRSVTNVPSVPIGAWFQLEVYLERATGPTGTFEVRQDGQLALSLTGVNTDDTTYGQWYVGNLAVSLTPPESVLYVDDVSIREMP